MKTFKFATQITTVSLLFGCASSPSNQDDGSTVDAEVGVSGCAGCIGIKTFTSETLASDLHAVRDAGDSPTGQRISVDIKLRISNRNAGLGGGLSAPTAAVAYLREITGASAHLFDGEVQTDANHPYRFLLRIHHNSSFNKQDVYLVTSDNKYILVPPINLEGIANNQMCFQSGCVWDANYVLSSKVISDLIAAGQPLKLFVGNFYSRQVQSKDGLNKTYETFNSGPVLEIAPQKLRTFLSTVRQKLGLRPSA